MPTTMMPPLTAFDFPFGKDEIAMNKPLKESLKPALYTDVLSVAKRALPWNKLQGKTLFLTGAAGLIGRYITLAALLRNDLYSDNIHVVAFVHNEKKARAAFGDAADRDDLTLLAGDVCDLPADLPKADFVIHAASPASAIQYEQNPVGTLLTNTVGTENVLKFSRDCGAESVLCASSLKVFGNVYDGDVMTEQTNGILDFTTYKNCYAEGKRATETLANAYFHQHGTPVKLVRPAYIYGACSLDDDRVWAQFIANVVRRENILLKSNGAAYRSFCYVADTAAAFLTVLLAGENGEVYNIADDRSNVTIRDFGKIAVAAFPERGLSLSFQNPEDEAEPPKVFTKTPEILDCSKLRALGFTAEIDIPEGVRRTVAILEESL